MTLADELRATFLFEHLTDEQLAWLVARGEEEHRAAGDVLYAEGAPSDSLWILLDGGIQLTRAVAGDDHVLVTTEQPGVYAGAVRAFVRAARETTYPTSARLLRDSRLFRIPSDVFTELLATWFPIALHLLDGLFLGVRNLEAVVRQQDKLAALGSLSAGLAHELNNPASAARRAAGGLGDVVAHLRTHLPRLAGTPEPALVALADLTADAVDRARTAPALDPLAAADREEELRAWLDDRGIDDAWLLAPTLADAGLDLAWAERAADELGEGGLDRGLHWLVDALTAAGLVATVREATTRISDLVDAVRAYTYLDQGGEQELDVHDGLEATLAVLAARLEDVEVVRAYDRTLPPVLGNGGDLNQVWTTLIDNAVDAMGGKGRLEIATRRDDDRLAVDVADTGAGIDPAIAERVFDPFFTTKEVGAGSGLGLDVARRIVAAHGGEISFTSAPGATRFTVLLPYWR